MDYWPPRGAPSSPINLYPPFLPIHTQIAVNETWPAVGYNVNLMVEFNSGAQRKIYQKIVYSSKFTNMKYSRRIFTFLNFVKFFPFFKVQSRQDYFRRKAVSPHSPCLTSNPTPGLANNITHIIWNIFGSMKHRRLMRKAKNLRNYFSSTPTQPHFGYVTCCPRQPTRSEYFPVFSTFNLSNR